MAKIKGIIKKVKIKDGRVPGTGLTKIKLRVKLVRSLIRYNWYHDKVGKTFDVTLKGYAYYYFIGKKGGLKHLRIDDCQIIK